MGNSDLGITPWVSAVRSLDLEKSVDVDLRKIYLCKPTKNSFLVYQPHFFPARTGCRCSPKGNTEHPATSHFSIKHIEYIILIYIPMGDARDGSGRYQGESAGGRKIACT